MIFSMLTLRKKAKERRAFNTARDLYFFLRLDFTHFKGNFENISNEIFFTRACHENEIQVPSAVDRPSVLLHFIKSVIKVANWIKNNTV